MKVICPKPGLDSAPNNPDAKISNDPISDWDEVLAFDERARKALKKGGKVGLQTAEASGTLFRWLRKPANALKSAEAKPLGEDIERAAYDFQAGLGEFKTRFIEQLALTNDTGDNLITKAAGGVKHSPETAARMKEFFRGSLTEQDLSPDDQRIFVPFRDYFVGMLNQLPEFRAIRVVNGKQLRGLQPGEDIFSPAIGKLFDPKDPNITAGALITTLPKELQMRVLHGKDPDLITMGEWIGAVAVQGQRKFHYDSWLEKARAGLSVLQTSDKAIHKAEAKYLETLIYRVAGKKTRTQDYVDDMINGVRESFGLEKFEFSPSAAAAAMITRNFYRGVIWGRTSFPLLNLTQTLSAAAKEGILSSVDGAVNFASKEGRQLVSEAQLVGDLEKYFLPREPVAFTQTGARIGEFVREKMDPWGYAIFNSTEYLNRGFAFHAALSTFMKKNGISSVGEFLSLRGSARDDVFKAGMRKAIESTAETQFMYGLAHQSPYLTSPLAKLVFGQFTSFPINQSEFILKNIKESPIAFPLRWITLTGMASAGLWYGAGVSIGHQLGGGGSFPEIIDLMREGRYDEARLVAGYTGGILNFMPPEYQVMRGLTPFLSATLDVLGVFAGAESGDPTTPIGRAARSLYTMVPGSLALRQASEALMAQQSQNPAGLGQRFSPGGPGAGKLGTAFESTGFLPLVNSAWNQLLGGDAIPLSGPLANTETLSESVRRGLGFRSREEELRQVYIEQIRGRTQEVQDAKQAASDRLALAMDSDPATFTKVLNEAVAAGVYTSSEELYRGLSAAMERRTQEKGPRALKKAPKAVKIEDALRGLK